MSKQSTNEPITEEEYNALLEEQQRQNDEVSFYEQSKHEAACHAPLASNEPCKYSWAEARAAIEAETDARDPDYESDYEHGGCCSECDGDYQDEPTYDCKWCKDGEDTTAPCICNADRREEQEQHAVAYAACNAQEENEYEAAVAAVRASFETGLERTGYGPFKEGIIFAIVECNFKFARHSKEWYAKFDTFEVVKQYRAWCWGKTSGSISQGW